jgi:hypothetical protein
MTPAAMIGIAQRVGVTQNWAGSTMAASPGVGRKWFCGDRSPPVGVVILFRLLDAGKVTPEDLEEAAAAVMKTPLSEAPLSMGIVVELLGRKLVTYQDVRKASV